MSNPSAAGGRGTVVRYPNRNQAPEHERVVHGQLAQRLARLLGMDFGGDFDPARSYPAPLYFVPEDTLIGLEQARQLGIRGEQDLFGGIAAHAFVPTKAISHPLFGADAVAPPGWSTAFGRRVRDAVIGGLTVFSLADARAAGAHLLRQGPIRIKPVLATGGRGQSVVGNLEELHAALQQQDAETISRCGLVLEENLEQVTTFSVGQVRVAELVASYYGTQRLTPDNQRELVYGGSDLVVVRGGFDALLALELPAEARLAVTQAQVYDQAAMECFVGLCASRRNYDVVQGRDAAGRQRSGVLEQSWRIGGASSAEIAALELFRADPAVTLLRTASLELFGEHLQAPANAWVLFRGDDAEVGFITKCATVEKHGNP